MKKLKKFLTYIISPKHIMICLCNLGLFKKMNDEKYLKMMYKKCFNKKLNLNNPLTFNEKLQWLKLNDRKEIYTTMVDKYEVKKYISNIIGEEYIIPTIAVYEKFDDINWNDLPNKFVIKCTHDSGGIVICKDKNDLNYNFVKKKISKSLNRNYYYIGREWPYKNLKPRIIIEKYMYNNLSDGLIDYKIHTFNGEPKIILVCKDRYKSTGMSEDFFSEKWEHLDVKRPNKNNSKEKIIQPSKLNEMLEISKKLTKDIPFARVDFYEINNKVYFGEITFYPASGFEKFCPEEWDYKFGKLLQLNK